MKAKSDAIHPGALESCLSSLGGALLVASGLRSRGVFGVFQAAIGGCLLWRGAAGCGKISGLLEREGAAIAPARHREASRRARAARLRAAAAPALADAPGGDAVTESSEESFPASDAPSWTPGHA